MNYIQSEPGQTNAFIKPAGLGAAIFLCLFALPFAGFGLVALLEGVKRIATADYKNGPILGLFGFVFLSVGLGLMAAAIWGRKKLNRDAALRARFPDQPWMVRPDWAAGKIKARATAPISVLLVWSFLALAISAPIASQIPKAWQKGNQAILIVLIFPVTALGLLVWAFRSWRARRRFGDCFFEPAQTPTPLGGVLEGVIQTEKRLILKHGLRLTVSCIRRVVSGGGKERHVTETPLWEDEKIYMADAVLPEPTPDHSSIPVHFKLPADQPECFSRGAESVFWRLEARTKTPGLGFHVVFDVPVFKVAGAIAEADNAADSDPTAPLQARIEDVRRDEHSRIRVSDGPSGREFYFPPARNIVSCLLVTMMTLVFSGIGVLTYEKHAPILFPIGFGFFGALLALFTFNVWFKSSRVTINSGGVQATDRWLFLHRSRHFNAGEIERFDLSIGTANGNRAFWNIKLIKRGGSTFPENKAIFEVAGQMPSNAGGVTLASDLSDRVEAAWLVQQMTKALDRLENQGRVFTVS